MARFLETAGGATDDKPGPAANPRARPKEGPMSDGHDDAIDMIRITFTADPERRGEIETYLADLGLDVHVWGDGHVTAFWEEPEGELDETIEALWEINEAPFEVTSEEFRRLNLHVYHHEEDAAEGQDRAVASDPLRLASPAGAEGRGTRGPSWLSSRRTGTAAALTRRRGHRRGTELEDGGELDRLPEHQLGVEAADGRQPVRVVDPRADRHPRPERPRPDLPEDRLAAAVREPQVEDDAPRGGVEQRERLGDRAGRDDLPALAGEEGRQAGARVGIVVDDQEAGPFHRG